MRFLLDNTIWVGLALGSGLLLLWPLLRRGTSGLREVSPAEAVLLINRESPLVLDVRSEVEFASGHIADARNIPLAQLAGRLEELAAYRDRPLLVNCQAGVRSARACAQLGKAGFKRLHNLSGGINAWKQAKLPLV